ncbi:MAG: complex I subunit 4 family protein [Gaiellales bacterium]
MISVSWLIAVPAIAAVAILLLPFGQRIAGYLSLLVSLAAAGAVIGFIYRFEPLGGPQFGDDVAWIEPLGVRWHVSVNGVSLAMIAITALITCCVIGYGMWARRERSHASFALILLTEAFLMMLFSARDLVVFYVGFEGMLIPLLVLLAAWGGAGRRNATIQMIAFTALGTLLMLLAIAYLGFTAPGGPDFSMAHAIGRGGDWAFAAFALALAIKAPLFPLHGWVLPSYRESQPEVAAVLSGLASKAGGYAFLAILVPLFPAQAAHFAWVFIALGAIGFLYAAFLAFRQPDGRGVVAYSSIAQMSFVVLGVFLLNDRGATGATFQMVNHALVSAALFLLAGWLETQAGSGSFARLGGLARNRPVLATTSLILGMAALAVPGSSVFASEFLILLGAFENHWWLGAITAVGIVLAAMYMLRWVSAVLHEREGDLVGTLNPPDLRRGALLCILPLVLCLLGLSIAPAQFTDRVDAAAGAMIGMAAKEAGR